MIFDLDKKEKKYLLETARESIRAYFEGREGVFKTPPEKLASPLGAFVTLHIKGNLRGCIGYILPVEPLNKAVAHLALQSAFHDPRFSPLTRKEFEEVDIEISVLSPLKKIRHIDEIKVGTHGIIMRRGHNSGVLLPQVPIEQGWDLEEFLKNTCYKAGMDGNCWNNPSTGIEIFSAVVFGELSEQ